MADSLTGRDTAKELKTLLAQIKKNSKEHKELQRRIEAAIAKLGETKFARESVTALEELEREEVQNERERLELLTQAFDARLAHRRVTLNQERTRCGLATPGSVSGGGKDVGGAVGAGGAGGGGVGGGAGGGAGSAQAAAIDSLITNTASAAMLLSQSEALTSLFARSAMGHPSTRVSGTIPVPRNPTNPFLDSGSQRGGGNDDKGGAAVPDLTSWELRKDEMTIDDSEVLGKGTFGMVRKGVLRSKPVAVKTIEPRWTSLEEVNSVIEDFKHEVAVMSKLMHPNVLLLMGVSIENTGLETKLHMVTELMPRGSCFDLIHPTDPKKKIVFKQRMKFAKDIALGMNWLHLSTPPILHLDLKPQNVLVDKNWVVKVADFGLSKVKQKDKSQGTTGSPIYMAPEVLSDKPYDEKADVYSFGILLWELLTGGIPYQEEGFKNLDQIFAHVVMEGKRPTLPPPTPPALADLIKKCWSADPSSRPSFAEVLNSHVLDDVIIEAIISPPNSAARAFWKENFTTPEEIFEVVSWKKFINAMVRWCQIEFSTPSPVDDQLEVKLFKAVLIDNKEEVVTIERFSKILEWLGPFTTDRKFLDCMSEIIRIPGFFGDITTKDAETTMAGKKPGNYIIRFSSQQPGFYTITCMGEDNSLKHYRIKHKAGLGFVLGDSEYPDLLTLIKTNRKDLYLKRAVKESRFASMVVAHDARINSAYSELMM
eukprot:TRINITY_DN2811_c0_g1_i2.p1 TRINITY_DN2811_c0_g1~~TRINITY_DN2811_c0_g1_i2.p1  ORF type:complete len:711 (-),score=170.90 TRINITY_DN2811_c0_g1_i2:53-2185(-)